MAQNNGTAHGLSLKNEALFITKGLINGEWVDAKSGKTFDVHNPSNGARICAIPEMSSEEVASAARHAATAFKSWREVVPKKRGQIIRKWAGLVLKNADDIGKLLTLENGKPFPEARGEIVFSAHYLDFYAGEAERAYGDVIPTSSPYNRAFTIKQPIGVVACLCPWNFPAAMITRKAGGALAAGCATVVKPAGETPLTANAIAYLAMQAGIPKGAINVIHCMANIAEVGKALCENKDIRKVSFTGSTAVGKLLMAQSSSTLKKLSMELGGNSPFIVFDDSPVDTAIATLMGAKVLNAGQACVAANRVYVQRGIYDALSTALVERFKKLKTGDGFEKGVTVGPLTTDRGVEKVHRHVKDAVGKGARLLLGGKPINGKGYFFEPSVLADMQPNMQAHDEEFFAPVIALYPFDTEAEVIDMANNSDVGLGSYICTNDIARMYRVAEKLETGMVGVNTGNLAAGELPFGGVKQSGFGLEGGKWGVEEFMVTKSVVIAVPKAKI